MMAKDADKNKFADVPTRVRSWGLIIIIFFTALIHPALTCLLVCFLSYQSIKELFAMICPHNNKIGYTLYPFILSEYYLLYTANYSIFLYLSLTYAIGLTLLNYISGDRKLHNYSSTLFISIVLCSFSISHLVFIKELNIPAHNIKGINILLLLVILTECNDVFQYLTGKTFGKNKVTPKISPNKTWEGLVGGLLLTTIFANILGFFLLPDKSFFLYSLIGVLIGILGFCGDIYISSVKRKAGVKDTSNLIPGHGGLLDRIDSLLFIAPVYYWLIYCIYS